MRKTLVLLTLLAFAAFPAFAQRGRGQGGGNRGGGERQGGHERQEARPQRQPKQDNRGRGIMRDDHINNRAAERDFHRDHDRGGYHYGTPRGEFRRHWDGRRFDHEFFESHWGYRHPFYWNHCGWYGPRWAIGSYFWYDGLYFEVIDPIPPYWYDGQVVIVYDEYCDCYYAINDAYPGVRIHIGIRF